MNKVDIRVAISGATGRMGRQLIKSFISSKSNNHELVDFTAAVTSSNSKFIGSDVGKLVGSEPIGITISNSIEDIRQDFDVLIDFSSIQATLQYLKFCNAYNKNMIIGTTGFKQEELSFIQSASKNIGIVLSPNFSVMINLMLKLVEQTASIIDSVADIKIIELHHRNKQDIPSGTALQIRQSILSVLSACDNQKIDNVILKKGNNNFDIDINSIRAGDLVGEHSVLFFNIGESLEIAHRAYDRAIFANGAILSAAWLGAKKVGLFNMLNVLGLDSI